jgi:hypothetical protein
LSNLPFVAVGAAGLARLRYRYPAGGLRPAYAAFFFGVLLTGFGSGYYHLAPANGPLVWDRLPMTLGFGGLFAIVVGEFVSVPSARRLLVPMLVVFPATVLYWAMTESQGSGDLRPYAFAQFVPMLLAAAIVASRRPNRPLRGRFALMIVCYVLAKFAEYFDAGILSATGGAISGHTLKHLLAAAASAILLYAVPRPASAGSSQVPADTHTVSIISSSPASRNFGGPLTRSSRDSSGDSPGQ